MNKKGQKQNTLIWVIVAVVGLYFLMQSGMFDKGSTTPQQQIASGQYPSDLKSDVTMSFKDDLATTETAVNATWYAFNGNGLYFASGTASAGSSTLYANIDSSYDIWAYVNGGESAGYLPKKFTVTTTNKPKQSETIRLVKQGGLLINNWYNTVTRNNATVGAAGTTEEIELSWKVNVSNAGVLNPLILVETNGTTYVEDISVSSDNKGGTYSEVTCPSRKTATVTGHQITCFQRSEAIYASTGSVTTYVNLKFAATAPDNNAWILGQLMDSFLYLKPGYSKLSDVIIAAEDDSDANIGAADSSVVYTYFNG